MSATALPPTIMSAAWEVRMSRFIFFFLLILTPSPGTLAEEQVSGKVPVSGPLHYTRLFADSTGASHFDDEEMAFTLVDFAPPAPAISLTQAFDARTVAIMSSPPGWSGDWHTTPQRQFIFVLAGRLKVQASDGEVRTFEPGAVILVEDTFGRGHISRIVGDERAYCVVVPLAEEQ